jgi:hypothetical protein
MVKIRKPKIPADLHLKYTGKRIRYLYAEFNPSFMSVQIETDANLGEEKDVIAFKVKLLDGSERYISLLSRRVYVIKEGSVTRDESGFITHYEFIVSDNLVFIKGQLFYNLDEIEEVYEYKLFLRNASFIYPQLQKYEIEFEDYTK